MEIDSTISQEHWYAQSANEANMDYANVAKTMILDGIKKVLAGN